MSQPGNASELDKALRQFEATESNLVKLEQIWPKLRSAIPEGIEFGTTPEYERLCREYRHVLPHLPAIDGYKLTDKLQDLNSIAQNRLDWRELGELASEAAYEAGLDDPGTELAEYRFRFNRKRRQLIRAEVFALMQRVDEALVRLREANANGDRQKSPLVEGLDWDLVKEAVEQIDVLLGAVVERPKRWGDLKRHLRFGQLHDLDDILTHDWPDARKSLGKQLFGSVDPMPVEVADLGDLVIAKPRGPVATKLKWSSLTDEEFERLLFMLISSTPGYENASWLMKTNRPRPRPGHLRRARDRGCARGHHAGAGHRSVQALAVEVGEPRRCRDPA